MTNESYHSGAAFDPDADAADDVHFDRSFRAALRDWEPVPEPPREAMWAHIDAARRGHAAGRTGNSRSVRQDGRRGTRSFVTRHRRGIGVAIGLAATLALGIGIGRSSALLRPSGSATVTAAAAAATDAALPYRIAAVEHLGRTEVLLTSLPASSTGGDAAEVAAWAGDLLNHTRLLLDSPAGDDPELGRLLGDLELLLAQVAALSTGRGADEIELIRDGMNHNDVMLRLRTVTTARQFAGT